MSSVCIRCAKIEDAPGIVTAIRSGFSPEQLELFSFGYTGVERYVASQISLSQQATKNAYLVAEQNGKIAACAHFQQGRSSLFLNHISVAPEYRGRGLGTALLSRGIDLFARGADTLELDVFETNSRALAWYLNLGFTKAYNRYYFEIELPDVPGGEFEIAGWPQAEACHEAFGFSSFTVTTDKASYVVGRLGLRWFRITSPKALGDPGFWFALKQVDPNRSVLALLDRDAQSPCRQTTTRSVMERLSAPLRVVRERVSEPGVGQL